MAKKKSGDSKEQTSSQNHLQTELLYQLNQALNRVQTEAELLQVLARPAIDYGATAANLLYFDLDKNDQPLWAEMVASWQTVYPIGSRFYLPDFPLARFWLSNPDEPVLLSNIFAEEYVNKGIGRFSQQLGVQALAVIPLTRTGRWVGLLSFAWPVVHSFTPQETELYHALQNLAAPVVENRRLVAQLEQLIADRTLKLQQEVDERRQAEAALQESQHQFKLIYELANAFIMTHDRDFRVVYMNPYAHRALGYESESKIGTDIRLLLERSEYERAEPIRSSLEIDPDMRIEGFEQYYLRRDGSRVLIRWNVSALKDKDGHPWGVLGVGQDITQQKQLEVEREQLVANLEGIVAERTAALSRSEAKYRAYAAELEQSNIERERAAEALNASELRYRVVSELTSDYAYAFQVEPDQTFTPEWITEAVSRITGYTLAELEERGGWPTLVHPDDKPLLAERSQLLLTGQPDIREFRIITKAGHIRWVRDYARPTRNEKQGRVTCIYGAAQDITERRQLEEQFRQSQKMEAIGKLASGVAHDFNNILTVIMGNCDFLLNNLKPDDLLRKDVEQIERAGARAASLTRQLLAFSRQQVLQPTELDLNEIITNLQRMLERLIGEDIDLITLLDPHLRRLKADPGQIEQVIMNLVVNARDAMSQGGKLTLETKNVYLNEAYVDQHVGVTPGPYALLAISDTGVGMDKEVLSHIFEPFFTTKELGKGTGLGLAMVHGIVTQSGGHIWVDTEPEQGSTFKVYLPQLLQNLETLQAPKPAKGVVTGSETILLVEDEDLVREMTRRVLRKYGYTVLEASDGQEALTLCEAYQEKINLLITDIVMPGGMNGHDLAEYLTTLHPEMKVLYMSGYTDTVIGHRGILAPGITFLQKPFTPTVLIHKVRGILDVA
jgi:PAS domain S-box-containing protein